MAHLCGMILAYPLKTCRNYNIITISILLQSVLQSRLCIFSGYLIFWFNCKITSVAAKLCAKLLVAESHWMSRFSHSTREMFDLHLTFYLFFTVAATTMQTCQHFIFCSVAECFSSVSKLSCVFIWTKLDQGT